MSGKPIIETPEELERLTSEYFAKCLKDKITPTTAGLALYLGFASRQSLYDYGLREPFSYVIKRAILAIESHHEASLGNNICAGSIFWLKNHKWSDQQQIKLSGDPESPLTVTVRHVGTDD